MTDNQASGPRFPIPEGFRLLQVGERLLGGDQFVSLSNDDWDGRADTNYPGFLVQEHEVGCYFRPIPAPPAAAPTEPKAAPEGRAKSAHISCTYCRGLGFIPSSFDIRQPICHHCCGTKDEPEPHRAPFAPQAPEGAGPAPHPDKAEMDKLCAFILMNFTGEWDRKESTADVAIRYLKSLTADRDAADKSLKAFVELEMEARKERDAARAQVSTLTAALAKAREAMELAFIAMGRAGANADTNHPLREAWESARAVVTGGKA